MSDTDKNCPHCGTHIDDHPVSRCFDLWIGEAVMGWHTKGRNWYDDNGNFVYSINYERDAAGFDPSDSIVAAWEVVEMVIDPTEDEFDLHFIDGWIATFSKCAVGVFASMDPFNPALAICRAAIKAMPKKQGHVATIQVPRNSGWAIKQQGTDIKAEYYDPEEEKD